MNDALLTDRRWTRGPVGATEVQLVDANLRAAQRQLAEARDHLIAARRRVVALEEAVNNWAAFSELARQVTADSR